MFVCVCVCVCVCVSVHVCVYADLCDGQLLMPTEPKS